MPNDSTGKNFTVYLSSQAFVSNSMMHETLGHELVHVQNYVDHWSMSQNTNTKGQWWVNTEAAAYRFSADSARAFGETAAYCNDLEHECDLYSESATEDWGGITTIPVK